jgi:imidazolonepropionase-like amidohydrolase
LDRILHPLSYHHFQLIERLRVTLENGATTARDLMGVDAGVRDAVADGLIPGPRLLVAIDMMSQTSGHADFHLPSVIDLTPFVGGSLVDSVDDARRRTRELIASVVAEAKAVVVRGDPLADIDALGKLENILLVLKGGAAASDRGGFLAR